MKTNKIFLSFLFSLLLTSCGGGSIKDYFFPVDAHIPAPEVLRTDLYSGFYLTSEEQYAETSGSVSLLWVGGLWTEEVATKVMQESKLPVVFDVAGYVYLAPVAGTSRRAVNPAAIQNLRNLFSRLRQAGVLNQVVAIAPIDEPNLNVESEVEVLEANRICRLVASEFQEISRVNLAVIYAIGYPYWGISGFNWVGVDDYPSHSLIFTNGTYAGLVSQLSSEQRTIILPGGYIGQDPVPFFNWAERDSRVILFLPFLWADVPDFPGIRSLPVRDAYLSIGRQIVTGASTSITLSGD